jgi:hypothetical protein
MKTVQSNLKKAALAATIAIGALTVSGAAARADVACNRFGECWHVHQRYTTYPGEIGVVFHDDAWANTHRGHHWMWRHDRDDDHGYYAHGEWHPF